jgi:hypothetical protein
MKRSFLAILALGASIIPLPAQETQPEAPPVRVLLDTLHREARAQDERTNFGQGIMTAVLRSCGATVDDSAVVMRVPEAITRDSLKPYDLVILNGRLRGRPAPEAFSPAVIKALDDHVFTGGFLLIISSSVEAGDGSSPGFFNPLLDKFGMAFNDKPAAVPGTQIRPASLEQDREHPLLHDIGVLNPVHGTTLALKSRKIHALAFLGDEPCLAVAPHGFGWCVALGGGSGWMNQGMDPRSPSKIKGTIGEPNQQFIRNLVNLVRVVRKGVRK